MRRRKSWATRRLLGLGGLGNEVGEEAERIEHGVAVVSLGRILEDAEKLVGRQAKEPPCFSVEFRPDLFTPDHDVSVFVEQPLGPRFGGGCHAGLPESVGGGSKGGA